MKLYTEEQVMKILFTTKQWGNLSNDYLIATVTPIELPSDDEAGVIALKIADTLKDKLTTEQESYLIAVFQTYSQWMKEQILNQNK